MWVWGVHLPESVPKIGKILKMHSAKIQPTRLWSTIKIYIDLCYNILCCQTQAIALGFVLLSATKDHYLISSHTHFWQTFSIIISGTLPTSVCTGPRHVIPGRSDTRKCRDLCQSECHNKPVPDSQPLHLNSTVLCLSVTAESFIPVLIPGFTSNLLCNLRISRD